MCAGARSSVLKNYPIKISPSGAHTQYGLPSFLACEPRSERRRKQSILFSKNHGMGRKKYEGRRGRSNAGYTRFRFVRSTLRSFRLLGGAPDSRWISTTSCFPGCWGVGDDDEERCRRRKGRRTSPLSLLLFSIYLMCVSVHATGPIFRLWKSIWLEAWHCLGVHWLLMHMFYSIGQSSW